MEGKGRKVKEGGEAKEGGCRNEDEEGRVEEGR